jgi:hypothetical protein
MQEVPMTEAAQSTEPPIAESRGGYFTGKLMQAQGRAELTARQLIWYQPGFLMKMIGLGSLVKGTRTFELDYTQIKELARGKFGINIKTLEITMADGTQHRFTLKNYDEFTTELRNQIAKHAKLIDAGGERWQVVAA